MTGDGSLAGELGGTGGPRAVLVYYPPGLSHQTHSHAEPHVSIVIAGSFRETTPGGDRTICHGSVGFRADEAQHSVSFGPAGALILTVENHDWIADGRPDAGIRWIGAPIPFARDLVRLVKAGGEAADAEVADRLLDLWAAPRIREDRAAGPPPRWLREAADRLLAEPEAQTIGGLARRLGVHRVHLTRSFLRHYRMAPSTFRRRAMASRALAALLGGEGGLAGAAAEAGFADQSHMSRAVRDCCLFGVGDLRQLLRGQATSVQSRSASLA